MSRRPAPLSHARQRRRGSQADLDFLGRFWAGRESVLQAVDIELAGQQELAETSRRKLTSGVNNVPSLSSKGCVNRRRSSSMGSRGITGCWRALARRWHGSPLRPLPIAPSCPAPGYRSTSLAVPVSIACSESSSGTWNRPRLSPASRLNRNSSGVLSWSGSLSGVRQPSLSGFASNSANRSRCVAEQQDLVERGHLRRDASHPLPAIKAPGQRRVVLLFPAVSRRARQ